MVMRTCLPKMLNIFVVNWVFPVFANENFEFSYINNNRALKQVGEIQLQKNFLFKLLFFASFLLMQCLGYFLHKYFEAHHTHFSIISFLTTTTYVFLHSFIHSHKWLSFAPSRFILFSACVSPSSSCSLSYVRSPYFIPNFS